MRTLDCRDMPVPKPVVLTRSALEELHQDSALTVIVNCDMSEDNILTYAQNKGYFVRREQEKAGVFITISKSFTCNIDSHFTNDKKIENKALIIKTDCIGSGLYGDSLMQEFLDAILSQKNLPLKIIFIDKGVRLTCGDENTPSVKTIKMIEEKGVKILVDLTSLDGLDHHKKHKIGKKLSMFELAETMINQETSSI